MEEEICICKMDILDTIEFYRPSNGSHDYNYAPNSDPEYNILVHRVSNNSKLLDYYINLLLRKQGVEIRQYYRYRNVYRSWYSNQIEQIDNEGNVIKSNDLERLKREQFKYEYVYKAADDISKAEPVIFTAIAKVYNKVLCDLNTLYAKYDKNDTRSKQEILYPPKYLFVKDNSTNVDDISYNIITDFYDYINEFEYLTYTYIENINEIGTINEGEDDIDYMYDSDYEDYINDITEVDYL